MVNIKLSSYSSAASLNEIHKIHTDIAHNILCQWRQTTGDTAL